jgi:hypothetical protein
LIFFSALKPVLQGENPKARTLCQRREGCGTPNCSFHCKKRQIQFTLTAAVVSSDFVMRQTEVHAIRTGRAAKRRQLMSRIKRGIIVVLGLLIALAGFAFARLWWASLPPSRPKNMPTGSIWIEAPAVPLEFSPRGWWMGCWVDARQNTNRCALSDWRGHVEFEDEYKPLTGQAPIPAAELDIWLMDSGRLWTWSEKMQKEIPVLASGRILVPAEAWAELRSRLASRASVSP